MIPSSKQNVNVTMSDNGSPTTTPRQEEKKMITVTKFINGKKTIVVVDPDDLAEKPIESPKKQKKTRSSASNLVLPDNFAELMKSPTGTRLRSSRYHGLPKSGFDPNMSVSEFDASMTFNSGDESFSMSGEEDAQSPAKKKKEYGKSLSALQFEPPDSIPKFNKKKAHATTNDEYQESFSIVSEEPAMPSKKKKNKKEKAYGKSLSTLDFNVEEESIPKVAGVNKKKHKSKDKKSSSSSSSSRRSVSPASSRPKVTPKMTTLSLASLSMGSLDSMGDDSFFFHEEDDDAAQGTGRIVPILDINIETTLPDIDQKVKSRKKTTKSSSSSNKKKDEKTNESSSSSKKGSTSPSRTKDPSPTRAKEPHSPTKKITKKSSSKITSSDKKKSADVLEAQQKRIKEIEKKLAKIEKEKKADLVKLKKDFDSEKEALRHTSMTAVEQEETGFQKLKGSGESMMEQLQQENQTLVDKAMMIHQEMVLAKKQQKLLEKNQTQLEKQHESLSLWMAEKNKIQEKKEKSEKSCLERYIPRQKEQLYASSRHCRVEHNIKNNYKVMLQQVVDAIREHSTDPKLAKQIAKLFKECQKEINEMPVVEAPEDLQSWLS